MLSTILASILLGVSFSEEDEAVYTLTTDNFDQFIQENPKVLVEFYAPWCGHCKALAPEYEKAAQTLAKDDAIDTKLAKVDATVEKDLASKYGVRGFPTLKYFTGDVENPDDYSGGRTEDTIVSWLSVRALPAVSQLGSDEDVNTFKSKSKVTLIGYLSENSEESNVLSALAEANRETVLVGQVTSEEVAQSSGASIGKIQLYTNFGDETVTIDFEGDVSVETLTEFLNSERFPLIDAIGPENYKDYMDRGLPLVWISVDASDDETLNKVISVLTPRAQDFKGQLSFTWVDNVKYAQHVQNLGISEKPGLLIAGEPTKYLFSGDLLNEEEVNKFFTDYKNGELEAYLKTQPVPETNDENVFVIVGSTFNEVVGKEKDVFVEFYAPWCGHCKRLAPEYEKVGDAFAEVNDIVIAKVDATENDTPEDIRGFPTLIFYKKGSTTGTKYNGERNAEAIIDYIKENSSDDIDTSAVKTEL